jgi:hypothetical protein
MRLGWRSIWPSRSRSPLAELGPVDHLAIPAVERDRNSVKDYDIGRAIRLATIKLVGYTEVVHALLPKLTPNASVVLFGGQARERPYPGSTTVTAVNGAVATMVRNLAYELPSILGRQRRRSRTHARPDSRRSPGDDRRLRGCDPVFVRQCEHERGEPRHRFRMGIVLRRVFPRGSACTAQATSFESGSNSGFGVKFQVGRLLGARTFDRMRHSGRIRSRCE